MKYKSDIPNLFIMGDIIFDNGSRDRVELGQFNGNGELETENQILINRLKELGYTPIDGVSQNDNKFTCKKCGQKFDNKGLLMAHYKESHPKPKSR